MQGEVERLYIHCRRKRFTAGKLTIQLIVKIKTKAKFITSSFSLCLSLSLISSFPLSPTLLDLPHASCYPAHHIGGPYPVRYPWQLHPDAPPYTDTERVIEREREREMEGERGREIERERGCDKSNERGAD